MRRSCYRFLCTYRAHKSGGCGSSITVDVDGQPTLTGDAAQRAGMAEVLLASMTATPAKRQKALNIGRQAALLAGMPKFDLLVCASTASVRRDCRP